MSRDLEASPLGTAVLLFMENRSEWAGSPSALFDALQPIAEDMQLLHHRSFPKDATWVWRRLKEVKVNLQEKGIECTQTRSGNERLIRLMKKGGESAVTAVTGVTGEEW